MRKLRKAAVVAAMIGSVGILGAGTAYAGGYGGEGDFMNTNINVPTSNGCSNSKSSGIGDISVQLIELDGGKGGKKEGQCFQWGANLGGK